MSQTDPNANNVQQRPVYEELQVVGDQLLTKVKELVHEGNVRRIIIKQDGRTIVELPLAVGVVGAIIAPALAVVGTLSALLTQCTIEVVRGEPLVPKVEDYLAPKDEPTSL